ncbi:MAG TPA: hypothetical protein VD836_12055 [Solirubrobacteraceae bacterium]|nr:hypothetical protein [Solirubrobacteraceae bacterium]
MRRPLLAALLLLLAAAPAAEAKPFTVGTGQQGGIAIDDGGTVYVGWQINTYEPGDAVQFCVLPPRATTCASQVTIPFPGKGYNRSRVSVLLPGPNMVDVIVPRSDVANDAHTYIARSLDGGRTFGPPHQLAEPTFAEGVQGPGGRVALVDGPTTTRAGLFPADGSAGAVPGAELGPYLEGVFTDIAASGEEVLAAGSDAGTTHAFRLPAGGDPNNTAAWQQLDPAAGTREPELAGLPGGFAVLLEETRSFGNLIVQRLAGNAWSPPVAIMPAVSNNGFALHGNARGRLTAVVNYSAYHLHYMHSTDGGVLWSSTVNIGDFAEYPDALEIATNARGAGAAVTNDAFGDAKPVMVTRFTPRSSPVARRRFRGARVQVRSLCDDDKLSLVVEAARGDRRIAPSAVLRRARFGRARGARRGFRTRFRARYELRRSRARIPVRVIPRRGKARTLRLRVRRC